MTATGASKIRLRMLGLSCGAGPARFVCLTTGSEAVAVAREVLLLEPVDEVVYLGARFDGLKAFPQFGLKLFHVSHDSVWQITLFDLCAWRLCSPFALLKDRPKSRWRRVCAHYLDRTV